MVVPPPAGPGAWAVGGEAFFLHFFFAFFLHFFLAACAGGSERSCATAAVEQEAYSSPSASSATRMRLKLVSKQR